MPDVTLAEATRVWLKIGFLSFGGPAGQISLMHRILVDEKRWIGETQFLHALNFCMLLPGPEAQQLATYIGWLLHRIRGGLIAGLLFILPGSIVIMALSYLYVTAGDVPAVQGLFVGLKASVVVIVLQAVIRIGQRSLRSAGKISIAITAFLAMFVWKIPFPYVILFAAIAGALLARMPVDANAIHLKSNGDMAALGAPVEGIAYVLRTVAIFSALWMLPTFVLVASLGPEHVFSNIGMFFSKMAVVTFGGAYAVLAYVSQEAVLTYQWLSPGEMIDGLAMAETTPGPLIMVTQFVGFIAAHRDPGMLPAWLAALLGGALTTWVTFVPCFMWIFAGGPFVERLRRNALLSAALAGVTAAVVGVIGNLGLWFAIHTLFADVTSVSFAGAALEVPVPGALRWPTLVITLVAAMLVFRFRASIITTLGVTGALGMLVSLV
jgi:chromate transporter